MYDYEVNRFKENIRSDIDPDISEKAGLFYQEFFPELWSTKDALHLRGETMCSLATTFGLDNTEGEFKPICHAKLRDRRYTMSMTSRDKDRFKTFRQQYHSLANFLLIPKELNHWRGRTDGCRQGDYFDIFLYIIFRYYLDRNSLNPNVREVFRKTNVQTWLCQFGNGKAGWQKFIVYNYLDSFVNSALEVKDLFSEPDEFKKENCIRLIGEYHQYGTPYPEQVTKDSDSGNMFPGFNPAVHYMENCLWIWDKRASLLKKKQINV